MISTHYRSWVSPDTEVMPVTRGTKLSKGDVGDKTDNKKQAKSCAPTRSSEVEKVGNENCHCVDCGKPVLKSQAGLACDACGFWHHTECEDVSDEVYEFLCDHYDDASLAWYCKKCVAVSKKLIESTVLVSDQQQQMEIKVEQLKIDVCGKMEQMNRELQELRGVMNMEFQKPDTRDSIVAVDEKVSKLVATVERQRTDNHDLRDCVQDAVREKLQEDKEEVEDIHRRSTNVIIHGLREIPQENREIRTRDEADQLQDMLHAIKCDDVSVQNMVRLGRYDSSQQTPRPMKVVLASDQQSNKILSLSKNLYGDRVYEKVYIQQDLTIKQREKRRELVRELKQRKAQGEANLIIVHDKIVTRRQRQQPVQPQPEPTA